MRIETWKKCVFYTFYERTNVLIIIKSYGVQMCHMCKCNLECNVRFLSIFGKIFVKNKEIFCLLDLFLKLNIN